MELWTDVPVAEDAARQWSPKMRGHPSRTPATKRRRQRARMLVLWKEGLTWNQKCYELTFWYKIAGCAD